MPKQHRLFAKLVYICLPLLVFSLQIFPVQANPGAFPEGFWCQSVNFSSQDGSDPFTLNINSSNGLPQQKTLNVEIIALGELPSSSSVDIPYQLAYKRVNASNWTRNRITFSPAGNAFVANASLIVDSLEELEYRIEQEANTNIRLTLPQGVDNTLNPGCILHGSDGVFVKPRLSSLEPLQFVAGSCQDLSEAGLDVASRFTCFFDGANYSYQAGSSACEQYATDTCVGQQVTTINGSLLPTTYGDYCLPCAPQGVNIVTVGYLEECDSPRASFEGVEEYRVCNTEGISNPSGGLSQLRCLDSSLATGQNGRYLCRYADNPIVPNTGDDRCMIGGADCATSSGNERVLCERSTSSTDPSWMGGCIFVSQSQNFCEIDQDCQTKLNDPGAVCGSLRVCLPSCDELNPNRDQNNCDPIPETPQDPNPTNPNEIIEVDPSTAFGIRNCPGASILTGSDGEPLLDSQGRVRAGYDTTSGVSRQEFNDCVSCIRFGGTWTAIGCIGTTPQALIGSLTRIGLGVMGGIALLRLIYLGFVYQTGDEGKIKEAREGVVSTLGAVVLVLFSVLILQIIGVNVLDIVPEGFFIPQ